MKFETRVPIEFERVIEVIDGGMKVWMKVLKQFENGITKPFVLICFLSPLEGGTIGEGKVIEKFFDFLGGCCETVFLFLGWDHLGKTSSLALFFPKTSLFTNLPVV
jgi:hypothetical protein